MAPEVYQGNYDQRCDIWSLGVILYIMLGGYFPFGSDSEQGLIDKVKSFDYDFDDEVWYEISDDAKDLIQSCLLPES